MSVGTLIISAVVGVGVGIISGMLGVGGGSIMVPLFRLGFGFQAIEATATSLFTIIPTSIAGVVQHIRKGTCLVPLGLATGIGGALTSPIGVHLASMSPGWAIMLATAVVIVYTSASMLRKGLAMPKEDTARAATASAADQAAATSFSGASAAATPSVSATAAPASPTPAFTRQQLLQGLGIGLLTGVMAGYIGLGGGFLMVPLFVLALKVPMKNATATSLLAICILSATGVVRQLMLGNVVVGAGLALALGTIPGALFGATLVQKVPERTLRILFGALLICVAILMVINELVVGA